MSDRVSIYHAKGSEAERDYLYGLAKRLGLSPMATIRLALGRLGVEQGLGDYPATRPVGRPPAPIAAPVDLPPAAEDATHK